MGCKKTSYVSLKEANKDIDRIKAKSTRAKMPERAYLCHKCNLYHLTSIPDYKKMYEELLLQTQRSKPNVHVKSLELKLFKLQTKHKELEKKYNTERAAAFSQSDEVKRINKLLDKKNKEIARLHKDNSQLINKNLLLEQKAVKWNDPSVMPLKEDGEDFSIEVLIHFLDDDTHSFGYYDLLYKGWYRSPMFDAEIKRDFMWTELPKYKK